MAYNSKYTGQEVENLLDQIANGNIGGGDITTESDPIFSASPAASITEAKKTEWDNKVDKVSGKQLSTEDFTSALKSKLEGLNNYDDTTISQAVDKLRTDLDATAIPLGGVVPIATEISSITSTSHSINYQTNSGKSLNGGYAGLYYLMCNHVVISQPFGWFGSTPMFRYPIKVHPLVLQSGAGVAISNVWQDVFIDIVPNTTTLEPYIINIYDSSGEKLTSHNLANCYIRGVRLGSFG